VPLVYHIYIIYMYMCVCAFVRVYVYVNTYVYMYIIVLVDRLYIIYMIKDERSESMYSTHKASQPVCY
jgi:hypothetical protein